MIFIGFLLSFFSTSYAETELSKEDAEILKKTHSTSKSTTDPVRTKSYLEDVYSYQEKDWFVTELIFDKPIKFEEVSVEYIRATVQVNVPGGFLKKPYSKRVQNEKVKSLYIYQPDTNTLRARVIYKKPIKAESFKGKVNISFGSRMLRISVKQEASKATAAPVLAKVKKEDINRHEKLDRDVTFKNEEKPLVASKATPPKQEKVETVDLMSSDAPVIKSSVKEGSSALFYKTFVALVFLMLLVAGFFLWQRRRLFLKNTLRGHFNNSIEVLYQYYLGPKKNLVVVKVLNETFLLGVTENNISFLKNLTNLKPKDGEEFSEVIKKSLSEEEKKSTASEVDPNRYREISFNEEVS